MGDAASFLLRTATILLLLLVVVVVVLTLTRTIKSVVTGQAPVTLELRNTPGKNTHNPRWYTHISQLTQFTPPPETYKSEIGSQSTMCQVQAGAYVSLLTPGGTKYSDCHLSKTNTYILHVVSITTSYTMSGRPGGVSGCPRAWYRSVSRLQAPRVHTRINSWGLFLVHKLTCGKRESVS